MQCEQYNLETHVSLIDILFRSIPTCRIHLQRTTFENNVAKGEIADMDHNETLINRDFPYYLYLYLRSIWYIQLKQFLFDPED